MRKQACKYLIGPNPVDGIYLGAASDVIMRERGIEFVDGTAPGFAAITGAAPTNEIAVKIAKELQEKNLYVFMAGCSEGKQFADQLAEEGVQLGWETRLIPFGKDVSALVYALGFASRAALSFGGVKPCDFAANLKYNKDRIFAQEFGGQDVVEPFNQVDEGLGLFLQKFRSFLVNQNIQRFPQERKVKITPAADNVHSLLQHFESSSHNKKCCLLAHIVCCFSTHNDYTACCRERKHEVLS